VKATINVPEIDWTGNGYHVDDEEPECTMCREPIEAASVRLPGICGHVHADPAQPCLQQAVKHIEDQGAAHAWQVIAEAVGKAPHRHSAATIRATIQNLAALASAAPTA
jgi:hypothetical protein